VQVFYANKKLESVGCIREGICGYIHNMVAYNYHWLTIWAMQNLQLLNRSQILQFSQRLGCLLPLTRLLPQCFVQSLKQNTRAELDLSKNYKSMWPM